MFLSGEAARGCAPPRLGMSPRRVAAAAEDRGRRGHHGGAGRHRALAHCAARQEVGRDADVTWTLLHHIRGRRLRDRALIALGMAALRVEDLQRVPQGLRLRISRPKTDQEGAGQVVAFPGGKRLRPVALVEAWLRPTTAATACAAGS